MQALISDVRTSEAEIDLAKSGYHPVIYAEVGPTYKDQVESSRTYEWGTAAMLRMNWNLFNGGADMAAVKGASARSRQSRQELQNQIDELGRETRSTWTQMLSAREQQRYFLSAIDYNVQTRDAYMQQFLVGRPWRQAAGQPGHRPRRPAQEHRAIAAPAENGIPQGAGPQDRPLLAWAKVEAGNGTARPGGGWLHAGRERIGRRSPAGRRVA